MCDHIPNIPVRFDIAMPEREYGYVRVVWAKGGTREKVLITSREVVGCMTHWIDGRTRPCYSPVVPCPGCLANYPRAWKGYLGGVCLYTHDDVIVMLTPHACRPWIERLRGKGDGVRGCILTLWHEGANQGAKTRLNLVPGHHRGSLPDPLDVEGQLKHIWAREAAARDPEDPDRWESIPIPGF